MSSPVIINDNMSDEEKISRLLPQVVELSKGSIGNVNGMMIVVFQHRYKNRFPFHLQQMVRSRARAELGKEQINPKPSVTLAPVRPAPLPRVGQQTLLFI